MEEYEELCDEIFKQTEIHISLEGIYKWILFPESRMDPAIPTANRYIGAYTNGEVKVERTRSAKARCPEVCAKYARRNNRINVESSSIDELKSLIPVIMEKVQSHLERLRTGRVPSYELIIRHTISKDADEYENNGMQAVVARTMSEAGIALKPGETAEYIIIDHTRQEKSGKGETVYIPSTGRWVRC